MLSPLHSVCRGPEKNDNVLDFERVVINGVIAYSWFMAVRKFATSFRNFLNHPGKVATICAICFVATLVLNGLLWRLWGLRRDYARLSHEISSTRTGIEKLTGQLKQAKDPSFIERQARDKLDLVGEKDLVFVFSDQ
jgi:cell division protein FtsB